MSGEGFRLPRLGDVRYFVDENLMAIGSALMRLRKDTVVAGQDPIADLVPRMDEEWIPVVAAKRWVAITNDRHIRTRYHEATPAIEYGLRCVHVDPGRDVNRWALMQLLMSHWNAVEALHDERGPVWLSLRRSGTRRMAYKPGDPPRMPGL